MYLQTSNLKQGDPALYYRLISLWVLCEAMLGGVIHGLRIPVSGLIVGSSAVICISLIAWYVPRKGAILKATIVVAIFKMLLSPQASFPAYIAVFFQGSLGELLFWKRYHYRLSCLVLGMLALLESGLQRILVLTIVYGNELWVAVNDFMNGLTRQQARTNYSLWLGTAYAGLHLLTGILVGAVAGALPGSLHKLKKKKEWQLPASKPGHEQEPGIQKRNRIKAGLLILWLLLLLLYLQAEFSIGGRPLLRPAAVTGILLRSFIIVLGWILLISPILNQLLQSWLSKKKARWKPEIAAVSSILPSIRRLAVESWKLSGTHIGLGRLKEFMGILLVNILREQTPVYILTGPIGKGKTTALEAWIKIQEKVRGILTPSRGGKRYFLDIAGGLEFPMEAGDKEEEIVVVGKFRFSKNNFTRAIAILERDQYKEGWLLIDEVGPLELKGEGFAGILTALLKHRDHKLLLVVREGLVDEVVRKFGIMSYETGTGPPSEDS